MNFTKIMVVSLAALAATASFASTPFNGWNYAIDASNDGSGGAIYEGHGLSFRVDAISVTFAISTNFPSGGVANGNTLNGSIGLGDLFINFSGNNLNTAGAFSQAGVYGVRFEAANDSLGNIGGSNTTLGVFNQVVAGTLTTSNNGYSSLQAYLNAGFGRNSMAMGDLNDSNVDVVPYLGNGDINANMLHGNLLGGITLLDRAALATMGLDFDHFGADPAGNAVYGFSMN